MQKCNLCYDRTSQGKGPMCATVCPTQAIFYGTYEDWSLPDAENRAQSQSIPSASPAYGPTRNYVVMREEDESLDIMSLVEEANWAKGRVYRPRPPIGKLTPG